jgi:hypothetical protein
MERILPLALFVLGLEPMARTETKQAPTSASSLKVDHAPSVAQAWKQCDESLPRRG